MATDGSISGDGVTLWFAPASAIGSELAADAKEIQSFVTNFNETRGVREVKAISVFGGGDIVKFIPQTEEE